MTDQLTWTPPVVEINGKEYKVRRLGIMDVMALGKIYASCQARQALQVRALFGGETLPQEALGALLIAAIPYEADAICKFLASVLLDGDERVTHEDFVDPGKFPLGSEVAVIEALIEHEDVTAFFDRVQRVMKSDALKNLMDSQNKSTESKGKRGGQTKKS